ncbi:MAG: IMPACT family protein [Microbacter sp.]
MNEFNTIIEPSQGVYKEKGSKFLAFAIPTSTEEEIKAILETMQRKYHDAKHICYAYILGEEIKHERSNDDGEPSGTAGRQILKQLQSRDLTNIIVVVVRYFGGVLLGTGPLSQAYKEATNNALQNNKIITKEIQAKCKLTFPYNELNTIMPILKKMHANIISQQIELECFLIVQLPKKSMEIFVSKVNSIKNFNIQILA